MRPPFSCAVKIPSASSDSAAGIFGKGDVGDAGDEGDEEREQRSADGGGRRRSCLPHPTGGCHTFDIV